MSFNNIDDTSRIGEYTTIGKNVIIEKNVVIGNRVTIYDNVIIRQGSYIGDDCIIGEPCLGYYKKTNYTFSLTEIGQNSIIRSKSIIYEDNKFGDSLETGHSVTIRERTKIGNNVRIGTLSDIQGHCEIGNYVRLHSNVHIGQASIVSDYVWIFPYVVLTNDPTPPSETLKGVFIEPFAVIATGSIILPGIRIGEDSLVGAGSIVKRDVGMKRVVVGNPAKDICSILDLNKPDTGKIIYPWKDNFSRGMPWEGYASYEEWRNIKN